MSPELGMKLKVRGKNGDGRHTVHQHGAIWEIINLSNTVDFDSRIGDWAHLESSLHSDYRRWCLLGRDNALIVLDVVR